MFSFDDYSIKEKTAKFDLHPICGKNDEPSYVIVKSATESNVNYRNALMKSVINSQENARKRTKLTANELEEQKSKLMPLFAKHVIVGFENLPNDDSDETVYSEEAALALLDALDRALPEVLTTLMSFCQDVDNFVDLPGNENVEQLAGN